MNSNNFVGQCLQSTSLRLESGVNKPTNQRHITFIALTLLVGHLKEHLIWPVKTDLSKADMVICMERGANDLYIVHRSDSVFGCFDESARYKFVLYLYFCHCLLVISCCIKIKKGYMPIWCWFTQIVLKKGH